MLDRTIREFMRTGAFARLGPGDTVAAAVELMRSQPAECVAVVEGDRLVGVFTERDFLNRVTAERRQPAATRLAEVMTSAPVTLGPDDPISYAINRMAVGGFRNVPIVDEEGTALAILNVRDVISQLSELFDALERAGAERATRADGKEWEDIGGGA